MHSILQSLQETGKYACLYTAAENTTSFIFARVLAVNERQTALYLLSPTGAYDGVLVLPTARISRAEWDDAYSRELLQRADTELPELPLCFGGEDYCLTVLRYAMEHGKIVSAELCGSGLDDAAGYVERVTDTLFVLRQQGMDGRPDGQCAVRLADVTQLCCDSEDERHRQTPALCSGTLAANEIRAVKLTRRAIEEMLWETFMEHGDRLLQLDPEDEAHIFFMSADDTLSELLFYACRIEDYLPRKDAKVTNYVNQIVEDTIDTIFETDGVKPSFQTLSF